MFLELFGTGKNCVIWYSYRSFIFFRHNLVKTTDNCHVTAFISFHITTNIFTNIYATKRHAGAKFYAGAHLYTSNSYPT